VEQAPVELATQTAKGTKILAAEKSRDVQQQLRGQTEKPRFLRHGRIEEDLATTA